MVSGSSCSPISNHIWNITFSSGYHILRENWINWSVSKRGEQDGMYLETVTCELVTKTLVVPGRRLEGNKRSGSKATKGPSCWRGIWLFCTVPEGRNKTSEVNCLFNIKRNLGPNKMGCKWTNEGPWNSSSRRKVSESSSYRRSSRTTSGNSRIFLVVKKWEVTFFREWSDGSFIRY